MSKINEHKLVNWVDGMNVSKYHQIQTEDYFIDALCGNLATRLTSFNYGLLPSLNKNETSTDFRITEHVSNQIELRLNKCYAMTAGGYHIHYNPNQNDSMVGNFSTDQYSGASSEELAHARWDVILSINPYNRRPTGEPDPEENPPRHPNAEPTYSLNIMKTGEVNPENFGMHHLIIGRIRVYQQRIEVDDNYIPPCTCMFSHTALNQYYEKFSNYMTNIEKAAKNIITKIQTQQKTSDLAHNMENICKELIKYIAHVYFSYRNTGLWMEPIKVVNIFSTMAHICLSSFDFIEKQQKEQLFKYFYDWNNVTPGAFKNIISDTAGIMYNHNSIRESMVAVETFLNILSDLLNTLSTLEYIGQTKDNVVVTVNSGQQENIINNWNVID